MKREERSALQNRIRRELEVTGGARLVVFSIARLNTEAKEGGGENHSEVRACSCCLALSPFPMTACVSWDQGKPEGGSLQLKQECRLTSELEQNKLRRGLHLLEVFSPR